ncbi:hypothetical protein M1307_03875 [Patescibacteria group bacterium]|nr:hypothetical protein [Patescibacteria group bacterium]
MKEAGKNFIEQTIRQDMRYHKIQAGLMAPMAGFGLGFIGLGATIMEDSGTTTPGKVVSLVMVACGAKILRTSANMIREGIQESRIAKRNLNMVFESSNLQNKS